MESATGLETGTATDIKGTTTGPAAKSNSSSFSKSWRSTNSTKKEIDLLAQDRFSKSVRQLNKLEASGLIEELLEKTGQKHGYRFNCTSNFTHPQFPRLWRDAAWHRRVTDIIRHG